MVLGLKSKHKKGGSVGVEYVVYIEEIRPWPPTESMRSVQTIFLQWENGDQNSGSFMSVAGEANIAFNESFVLPVTLSRDKKAREKFQKNYLEFSLFEPRKDKAAKGQLLGTASVNLADYGIVEQSFSTSIPMNLKKSSKNSIQPALFLSFEPVERESSHSSPSVGLSKESSIDHDDDGSEIASFTDDDMSSHSSRTAASSTFEATMALPSQHEKNESGSTNVGIDPIEELYRSLQPSYVDVSDTRSRANNHTPPKFPERSMTYVKKNATPLMKSSPSTVLFRDVNWKSSNGGSTLQQEVSCHYGEDSSRGKTKTKDINQQTSEDEDSGRFSPELVLSDNRSQMGANLHSHASQERKTRPETAGTHDVHVRQTNGNEESEPNNTKQKERRIMEELSYLSGSEFVRNLPEDATKRHVAMRSDTLVPSRKAQGGPGSNTSNARLKHMKSVQIHGSERGNEFVGDGRGGVKATALNIPKGSKNAGNARVVGQEAKCKTSDGETEWKSRIEMLEEEVMETAAVEVGLYSVIAEHASSVNKVHAPARRLSRFYLHVCRVGSQARRASAARAAVSGLVLVSRACGNDVQRLTFWLSNSIMLRAIVSQAASELPHSTGSGMKNNGSRPGLTENILHKQGGSSRMEEDNYKPAGESDDWEDILTYIIALEKVESWIFSRIVESLWWQTFTPHMQPTATKSRSVSNTKKTPGKRQNLGDPEQGNFSTELWKKAFKDACERLCPLRAGGHECGCLSVLPRLVMEQLVNRLDVAMFNAILRESAEEMPTDPVSDPISDSKVLPIPAGKSSFGAGAQLKNAIGNWSRWLTDLFGIEDDPPEDSNIVNDNKRTKSFKAFSLLRALSDLMMLPFAMLADTSIRKEVCPTFGPALVRRVLDNFVPDEFCPDPVPKNIIEALDSEEILDSVESLTSFPCTASPTVYKPPPGASLTGVMGEIGCQLHEKSGSSVIKKSYTSDDELDILLSPLTSIIPDSFQSSSVLAKLSLMPKEKGGRDVLRYQLLKDILKDGE